MSAEAARQAAEKVAGIETGPTRLPGSMRDIVRLAGATTAQWRIAGGGMGADVPIGFDMTAVDVVARWLGIEASPRLLDDLAVIEREALELMGKT